VIYDAFDDFSHPGVIPGAWIKYNIGELNPTAIFVCPERTYVSFKQANSPMQVWSNTAYPDNAFESEVVEVTDNILIDTKSLVNEVEIKIHLNKEEDYKLYYSVTKSKKIHVMDIETQNSPTLKMSKNLIEFKMDEELLRVIFFDKSKYVVVCAETRKCIVASCDKLNTQNRVIDVGFDKIEDVFVLPFKFFGVTHPHKKIIAFFELEEKTCSETSFKKCDLFDSRFALSCNAGYRLE
jgi:hypothetical protein